MKLKEISDELVSVLKLNSLPVGVKFYENESGRDFVKTVDSRFCQAVMEARQGKTMVITKENISCPAAAAALGLKPLTEQLKDGKALRGYGIFRELETGQKVMRIIAPV